MSILKVFDKMKQKKSGCTAVIVAAAIAAPHIKATLAVKGRERREMREDA